MIPRHERIRRIVTGEEQLRIDVESIGYLLPATPLTVDDHVVAKMTEWRNTARGAFLTQFPATPERTRRWLEQTVWTATDRLLLLIYTSDDQLIGQYGFIGLTNESVELDNLIRGERGGSPQLVRLAECALVDWLFDEFEVERVTACVLSSNPITIQLHADCGFQSVAKMPLQRLMQNDELHYAVCGDDGEASPDDCYQVVMEKKRTANER